MSLRLKIVLALAVLAVGATIAIGVASYSSTRHEFRVRIERSLDAAAASLDERPGLADPDGDGDGRGHSDRIRPRSFEQVLVQVLGADGSVLVSPGSGALPVVPADISVITSPDPRATARHEVRIDGEPFLVHTVKFGPGAAMLARSLQESQDALGSILASTLWSVLAVALVAVVSGWLIARQVTRRLERLTDVAGQVASTGRLDVEVPIDGRDETGTLGRAFRGMLDALHRSRHEQQQLVQDAGHELRTPLTSLRTNVSVLRRRYEQLDPASREQLLADLDSETRELTDLVNELVELATEGRDDEPVQHVVLGDIAERTAARARRRFGREVEVVADDSSLDGRPNGLERALQNLVDNACKFADDGAIEMCVHQGTVSVRDHGPGLQAADVPQLFDRFFRSVDMRSKPGSGLGLSIVKSIVESHGGSVFARNAPDGGAIIGFHLPVD